MNNSDLLALSDRLRMRFDRESGMSALDETVLKYGYVQGNRFSFHEHEFQRQIIKDTSSRIAIRKCSQVGLSEVMVQKLLAMASSMRHVRIIFTLPTKEMATSFSKDRIDGAIEQSDFYGSLTTAGSNSASQKKIGSCHIYVAGTFGANQAISVPAEIVICDEVDFSNPVVLGKLNSRLRHANIVDEHGYRGIKYMFSTPTVDGYGVDLEFQKGDQQYYLCKCEHCETWVRPEFQDFRVPGWDDDITNFSREDSYDPKYQLTDTTIRCSSCSKNLFSSLINPDRRQWVAAFPGRHERSYQVSPWDVPTYNTPNEVMRQIQGYPLKSDFYNFVLGLPFSDANNSFNTSDEHRIHVTKSETLSYLSSLVLNYMVMGMDVGKTCHLSVGLAIGRTLHVVWLEKIENSRHSPATPEILARYDFYRCVQMCVDSGPDITLVNNLTSARPDMRAVVYVRNISGPKLFEEKSSEPVVNVDRTKSLTYLLTKHNSGDIYYPKNHPLLDEVFQHLRTTKKIRRQNTDGTFTELFQANSDNDHWVHSLHYLMLAGEMKFGIGSGTVQIIPSVSVGTVRVGENNTAAKEERALNDKFKKHIIW